MDTEKNEQTTAGESQSLPESAGETAQDASGGSADAAPGRLSWEEILADPAYRKSYDEAVGRIVQRRLRSRAEAEERLRTLTPVLDALRERYGEREPEELAATIRQGESLYGDGEIRAHLEALFGQAAAIKSRAPDFDLLAALEDPAFLRLTAPHSGVSPADAWYALHRDEIGAAAARESLAALSRSLRTQAARPRENHGGAAVAGVGRDARSLSRQEREELKKRILEAKAQGRRLSVGE